MKILIATQIIIQYISDQQPRNYKDDNDDDNDNYDDDNDDDDYDDDSVLKTVLWSAIT
jgi:hypothetical protein